MAPSTAKSSGQAIKAELTLLPLKSCLVNLPASQVSALVNANAAAQDVIVELQPQRRPFSSTGAPTTAPSIYVGWTGMPSKRRMTQREQDVPMVELDATFAHTLGLEDAEKISVSLHLNPSLAHTVHIEPATSADWEIIELHATFLELNMLSQIRALPNPLYTPSAKSAPSTHPLTLHLSPTSTANILIKSFDPPLPSSVAFAKIAPDAEVIVAPKARKQSSRNGPSDSRSVASTTRKSTGGRSAVSTSHQKSNHDMSQRGYLFLRAVDRGIDGPWFDNEDSQKDIGLRVWVDDDLMVSRALRGCSWVFVTIVKPASLEPPREPQQSNPDQEDQSKGAGKPAKRLVARLCAWEGAPDCKHAALSSALCSSLESENVVGGLVQIEAASSPLPKSLTTSLTIYPFSAQKPSTNALKFGGATKSSREDLLRQIRMVYQSSTDNEGFLDGPLTDGMILPLPRRTPSSPGWQGGILRVNAGSKSREKPQASNWLIGGDVRPSIEIESEIPHPSKPNQSLEFDQTMTTQEPVLVGIDPLVDTLTTNLLHGSSVLLSGTIGAGKTDLAKLLSFRLRRDHLFNVSYLSCRSLVKDEARVSSTKEVLNRLLMAASWGARNGGRALVVLDDLQKLCPAETELQVGGENGRSRQVSEIVKVLIKQYCTDDSRVVLLATAQSKESLNSVIVGGHVVRELVSLKAPDKQLRRTILELLTGYHEGRMNGSKITIKRDEHSWVDTSDSAERPASSGTDEGFKLDRKLDLLQLAGEVDGYMPGDLGLLVARAKSEAIIRDVDAAPGSTEKSSVVLEQQDFSKALKGFTPASLRNVTLQTSKTTFDSIGGLKSTRKILLETLQYPTKYAPIFAQCPLRLRSGLLLYGFPGCGKTLLASAVAGECGLNFISVKGPEILNKYIGASEKSVRDLFERAEAAKPCVLFFDEFDSIAPKRGHDSTGVTDRVVNQLLTQMDGAEGLSGVYVLAATSRPDLIDPALLRPGRLDKSLLCDMPNEEDRLDILQALSKKLKMSVDVLEVGLSEVAKRTEGYSGADLQALVYNAHLEAIHDILGDRQDTKKPRSQTKSKAPISHSDFLQFTFGDESKPDTKPSDISASQELIDRTAIRAQLETIRDSKKQDRDRRRGNDLNVPKGVADAQQGQEVTIESTHLSSSLKSTKSSISAPERKRLQMIYREFIVGRNGEMPSGDGSTEVGGRTSLM